MKILINGMSVCLKVTSVWINNLKFFRLLINLMQLFKDTLTGEVWAGCHFISYHQSPQMLMNRIQMERLSDWQDTDWYRWFFLCDCECLCSPLIFLLLMPGWQGANMTVHVSRFLLTLIFDRSRGAAQVSVTWLFVSELWVFVLLVTDAVCDYRRL